MVTAIGPYRQKARSYDRLGWFDHVDGIFWIVHNLLDFGYQVCAGNYISTFHLTRADD